MEIGDIINAECLGCDENTDLRYDGVIVNPVKKTEKPVCSCMSCKTTRVYEELILGSQGGK